MLPIDRQLYDAGLAAQGKMHLMANAGAAEVDRTFQRFWSRAVVLFERDPNRAAHILAVELRDRIFLQIRDHLRAVAIDAWNDRARLLADVLPRPLLTHLARQSTRPTAEARSEGGGLVLRLRKRSRPVHLEERRAVFFGQAKQDVAPEYRALFEPPTAAELDAAIIQAPFQGMTWPQRLQKWPEMADINHEIRAGLLRGETRQQVAGRLISKLELSRASANRIARTETARVAVHMQMRSTEQVLGDAQAGWRYVATLDDRTRPEHAALDGTVYGMGDAKPELPSAWNCRCDYAPAMKSLADLGLPPDLDALFEPAQRAAFQTGSRKTGGRPGPVAGKTTYPTWFNRQPARVKRHILGARRYDALRKAHRGPITWTLGLQAFGLRAPDAAARGVMALFPGQPVDTPPDPNNPNLN